MDSSFSQKIKVSSSMLDSNVEVGIIEASAFIQDNMCEYFRELKCDGITIIPTHHAFWAVTKSKVIFNKPLFWLDNIDLTTSITKKSAIRINLHTVASRDNDVGFESFQEICAIDMDTRKLRAVDSTPFPKNLEICDSASYSFEKFDFDLDKEYLVKEYRITSCDVDHFHHTNNVSYVKILYSTFDIDFIKDNIAKDFEIHYIKESKYMENLKVFRKIEDKNIFFHIKNDNDETIVKAKLSFESR